MRLTTLSTILILAIAGCSSSKDDDLGTIGQAVTVKPNAQSDTNGQQNTSDTSVESASGSDADSTTSQLVDEESNSSQIINESNYEQLLRDTIDILNLNAFDSIRQEAIEQSELIYLAGNAVIDGEPPSSDNLELASRTPLDENDELVFSCDGIGSLTSLHHDLRPSFYSKGDVTFMDCLLDGRKLSGNIQSMSGRRSDSTQTFNTYTIEIGPVVQTLVGEWSNAYAPVALTENQSWTDATLTTEGTDADYRVDGFNWNNSSLISLGTSGYVKDAEGIVRPVEQISYTADLQASFLLTSKSSQQLPVSVTATLGFVQRDFFEWRQLFADGIPIVPEYPVIDLGSPVMISASASFESGPFQSIDQNPKDARAQWQNGELFLSANDGSKVIMRPDSKDKTKVQIELNGSGSPITRLWSEGFQIECAHVIEGCGRAERRPF